MAGEIDVRCAAGGDARFHYAVAGVTLRCQFPLPQLSIFESADACRQRRSAPARVAAQTGRDGAARRACGWVGGAWRDVTLASRRTGFRMAVPGVASFEIDAGGTLISIEGPAVATASDVFMETLIGPVLVFTLALRGIWCMHAAAVRVDGGVVLFVGESGSGKSTLARFLLEHGACEERIADDILPVAAVAKGLVCLPPFPQLKLAADGQYRVAGVLPISAVYELNRADDRLGVERYDPARAALAWVRHTVAARLFPDDVLRAQFQFAADAAHVPVFGVRYPHCRRSLDWFSRQVADPAGPVAA